MHSSLSSGSRFRLNSLFSTLPVKLLVLSTTLVPLHSINASKASQYNTVVNSNTLTVVTVENPTTVFQDGNLMYGFGHDLVRNYAQNLNVQLNLKMVSDNATALKWVSQGKADMAMTTADFNTLEKSRLTYFSATCGDQVSLSQHGLNPDLNWVFKQAEDPLAQTASGFICQGQQNGVIRQLASFYDRNVVEPEAWQLIQRNLSSRLPIYKASFQQSAARYDLDWHLLAAIGYQESYLKSNSVSPTGVRGLMMLTSSTAKAMGISNRTDPHQSIQGGAKYYDLMLDKFSGIPYPERNWYALVAYNMGPGAVNQVQKRIQAEGRDPNNWLNLYDYLQQHQAGNGRYRQAVQYVTRIRSYLEHIKRSELVNI